MDIFCLSMSTIDKYDVLWTLKQCIYTNYIIIIRFLEKILLIV